jgi:hypothetical protein
MQYIISKEINVDNFFRMPRGQIYSAPACYMTNPGSIPTPHLSLNYRETKDPKYVLRLNSWTKSRQKSEDFSSLLFTVTSSDCLEVSISSSSRKLLQFLQFSYTL